LSFLGSFQVKGKTADVEISSLEEAEGTNELVNRPLRIFSLKNE